MNIESSILSANYMDTLSRQKTYVHLIDPRIKIIITCVYCVLVLSCGAYQISALVPFVLYPVFIFSAGNIPVSYIIKKILFVSPFAVMIAAANLFIDTKPVMNIGQIIVTGGWISFFSIIIKFILTVVSTLLLVATTGFDAICFALSKLKVPDIFITQLLLLYRYIFVLTNEAGRMVRAKSLRTFSKSNNSLKIYGSLLGNLLIRTMKRGQRLHLSMVCRGFTGKLQLFKQLYILKKDIVYFLLWIVILLLFRIVNIAQFSGNIIRDIVQ